MNIALPKTGEIFNKRYQILSKLGSGGAAVVLKALQLDANREIALKIWFPSELADSEFKVRFLREARALNALKHTGIVTVYHVGLSESGLAFIAMELLEGRSLQSLLQKEHKLPLARAINICGQLAGVLQYVHENGIVHRDLKPENIMLLDKPEADTVKIVDFGLARQEQDQKLTKTGTLIGSAFYMSPEQSEGKKVDLRSDIYSLSLCFFEMLCGEKPYTADTAIGILYKHINAPLPSLNEFGLNAPQAIDQFLKKGMAKDPAHRFQSMHEFLLELNRLDPASEFSGPVASPKSALKALLPESPALRASLILSLLSLFVLGMLFSFESKRRARQYLNSVDSSFGSAKSKAELKSLWNSHHRWEELYKKVHATKDYAGEVFMSAVKLTSYLERAGQLAEAEKVWKGVLKLFDSNKNESRARKLQIVGELAKCRMQVNDYEGGGAIIEKAVKDYKDLEHSEVYYNIEFMRIELKCANGDYSEANEIFNRVVKDSKDHNTLAGGGLLGPDDPYMLRRVNMVFDFLEELPCRQVDDKVNALRLLNSISEQFLEFGVEQVKRSIKRSKQLLALCSSADPELKLEQARLAEIESSLKDLRLGQEYDKRKRKADLKLRNGALP